VAMWKTEQGGGTGTKRKERYLVSKRGRRHAPEGLPGGVEGGGISRENTAHRRVTGGEGP